MEKIFLECLRMERYIWTSAIILPVDMKVKDFSICRHKYVSKEWNKCNGATQKRQYFHFKICNSTLKCIKFPEKYAVLEYNTKIRLVCNLLNTGEISSTWLTKIMYAWLIFFLLVWLGRQPDVRFSRRNTLVFNSFREKSWQVSLSNTRLHHA